MVVWILTLLKGPTQPPATVGELEMVLLVGDLVCHFVCVKLMNYLRVSYDS